MFSDDVRAFLEKPRFAVLATIMTSGLPQQSVVWFLLEGDEILMNTRRGRIKDRNMRRDPRISVCFEDGYRYLVLSGTALLVDDQAVAQADIQRLALRYHDPETVARQMRDQFSKEERVTVRLTPSRVAAYGFS